MVQILHQLAIKESENVNIGSGWHRPLSPAKYNALCLLNLQYLRPTLDRRLHRGGLFGNWNLHRVLLIISQDLQLTLLSEAYFGMFSASPYFSQKVSEDAVLTLQASIAFLQLHVLQDNQFAARSRS